MSIQEKNYPVARRISDLIREKGIKQGHIAVKAGYSENEFSAMLNGRKIIIASDIPKIAKALEIQPNDLFLIN